MKKFISFVIVLFFSCITPALSDWGSGSWDASPATPDAPENMVTTDTTQTISGDKTFSGTVAGISASGITTGTLPDAQLSANVDLLDGDQTITGTKTLTKVVTVSSTAYISGNIGVGTTSPGSKFDLLNGSVTIRGTNAGLRVGTAFFVNTNGVVSVGANTTASAPFEINVSSVTLTKTNTIGGFTFNDGDSNPIMRIQQFDQDYSFLTIGRFAGNAIDPNEFSRHYLIGFGAGSLMTSASSNNTCIGHSCLSNIISGGYDVGVGAFTGYFAPSDSEEVTFLGYIADGVAPADGTRLFCATAVGAESIVAKSSSVVLGRTIDSVGIGTTAPYSKLDVVGGSVTIRGIESGLNIVNGSTELVILSSGIVGKIDGSVAPAGYVGQVISSAAVSTNFPTSTQYGDIVSMTITPGTWLVSGNITAVANGATVVTYTMGISATSGNSSSGLVKGSNLAGALPPVATSDSSTAIVNFPVTITSNTTYYFKASASYSVATPQANVALRALRIY